MADAQLSHSLSTMAVAESRVFDVDQHTWFMGPDPPLDRLPQPWEAWEIILDAAVESKLQLGDKLGLTEKEKAISKEWRNGVQAVFTNVK